MALQPQNERPFGFRDKLGYLFGDFGNDFTFIFAGSYLTLFYTDVLGVSAGLVGVLFVVARCVDAFTDVGMGRLVDTLPPSRGGRFRPWILRVCVPVALASVLMYLYFARSWPYAGKVAYMFATYISGAVSVIPPSIFHTVPWRRCSAPTQASARRFPRSAAWAPCWRT